MKININGKEVEIVVNGEKVNSLIKKAKLADLKLSPDEVVKKAKEAKEESNNVES